MATNKETFNLCIAENPTFTAEDFRVNITNNFAITLGGIHYHGALIQTDSYRVVDGGSRYLSVQAIKDGFVVFSADVPRNRRRATLATARALHLVW